MDKKLLSALLVIGGIFMKTRILLLIIILLTLTSCTEEQTIDNTQTQEQEFEPVNEGEEIVLYKAITDQSCTTEYIEVYKDLVFSSNDVCMEDFFEDGYYITYEEIKYSINEALSNKIINLDFLIEYIPLRESVSIAEIPNYYDVEEKPLGSFVYVYEEGSIYHETISKSIMELYQIEDMTGCTRIFNYHPDIGFYDETYQDHIPYLQIIGENSRKYLFYGEEIITVLNTLKEDGNIRSLIPSTETLEDYEFKFGTVNGYLIISNPKSPTQFMETSFSFYGYIVNYSVSYNAPGLESIGVYLYKDGIEYTATELIESNEITMDDIAKYFPQFEKEVN